MNDIVVKRLSDKITDIQNQIADAYIDQFLNGTDRKSDVVTFKQQLVKINRAINAIREGTQNI